jgi:hypothetical protein
LVTYKDITMAEFARPATYVDKLQFAQRVVKAAQYRTDQRQAVRELCEGMTELITALLDREQGREVKPNAAPPEQTAAP